MNNNHECIIVPKINNINKDLLNGWKIVGKKQKKDAMMKPLEETISIASRDISKIIGYSGYKLRELERTSQSIILIPRLKASGKEKSSNHRVDVTIRGSQEAIQLAKQEILRTIANEDTNYKYLSFKEEDNIEQKEDSLIKACGISKVDTIDESVLPTAFASFVASSVEATNIHKDSNSEASLNNIPVAHSINSAQFAEITLPTGFVVLESKRRCATVQQKKTDLVSNSNQSANDNTKQLPTESIDGKETSEQTQWVTVSKRKGKKVESSTTSASVNRPSCDSTRDATNEQEKMTDCVTETIAVPEDCARWVIGKGGLTINNLRSHTQTSISVVQGPGPALFTVLGQQDRVQEAKAIIRDLSRYRVSPATHPETPYLEMRVTAIYIGVIHGKKGQRIRDIREKNDVVIYFPDHESGDERLVIVGRTVAGVNGAKARIEEVIGWIDEDMANKAAAQATATASASASATATGKSNRENGSKIIE